MTPELETVRAAARAHATATAADVANASSRQEQIRLSVTASEAARIADALDALCGTVTVATYTTVDLPTHY